MLCGSLFVLFSFFLLATVLSVLLPFTASDHSFGIFKLFLCVICGFSFKLKIRHLEVASAKDVAMFNIKSHTR